MDEDDHMSMEDIDMEDEELQMALMISMSQAQPGEAQVAPQAAVPAAAPPAAPAHPPAAAPANQGLSAHLQQALVQALANQMYQPPQMHQPPQQQQQPQQQPAAAAPQRRAHRSTSSSKQKTAAAPKWAAEALADTHTCSQSQQSIPAEVPVSPEFLEAGGPLDVVFSAAIGSSFTALVKSFPPGSAVTLPWMRAAVQKVPVGDAGWLLTTQRAWLAAEEAAGKSLSPAILSVMRMLQLCLAARPVKTLAEDEDDLFFEGGRSRTIFLQALEAGQVAPLFLNAMVSCQKPAEPAAWAALWTGVLKDAFSAFDRLSLAAPESHEAPLRRLDVLTQCPALKERLGRELLREAVNGAGKYGKEFEKGSLMASLLGLSALPAMAPGTVLPLKFRAEQCFTQLRGYPRNRGSQIDAELSSIRRGSGRAYTAAHEILKRVATLKPAPGGGLNGREVVPAWLAAVAAANVARSEAGSYLDRVLSHRKPTFYCSSDAFLIGATAVGLRFCRPFMSTPEKKEAALAHLDPTFYRKNAHRVVGAVEERSLSGAVQPAEERPALLPFPAVSPDRGEADAPPPHFVAESFFATQRLIRVGLVPAIYRFQALAKLLRQRRQAAAEEEEDEFVDEHSAGASMEEWLLADSVRAALLDPEFGADLVAFCELTARWVLRLLRQGSAADAVAVIPESAVRDMCVVLHYLISQRATELLGGADVGCLISCLTAVLRATDLIPSPAVHFSVVQLLVAMLSPQLGAGGGRGRRALARQNVSSAEAALVSAVLGTGAAQTELLPALMSAYAQADHVVGLDVDKDAYDKFALRTWVDLLLMELWRDPACARSLVAVAAAASNAASADHSLFPDFCGAVLNDLIYLLKDSLGRLEDIATLERSMADEAAWAAAPPAERDGKLAFYRSQQRTAAGFLRQALTALKMLNTLAASRAVQAGFVGEEVGPRSAGAAFDFIDLLVGPRCAELAALKNPIEYGFDPDQLLLSMCNFLLRLAEQPAFVAAMAAIPDYDEAVLQSAIKVLEDKQLGEYEHRARLEALVTAVAQRRGRAAEAPAAAPASEASLGALDAEAASVSAASIEEVYQKTVGPLSVGEFDASLPRAYNRHFAVMADKAAGDVSKAAKRISRELRDLTGKMALPVYAGGSVLVRHDANRLDKMRAWISGPEGTPYEGGLFFFDVFFPAQYPATPPLMELETTGGGTSRFNPNLYADGKVCLSLLGTWHGGSESEKWNPKTSTLWQVLVSIQSQVLVPEPYFNEPAYEGMKGTKEGAAASLKYNAELWLNTMRHAMADVMRRPRPGFEEAIVAHFKALRPRLVKRLAGWVQEAAPLGPMMVGRLEKAAAEVRELLAGL